MSTTCRPYYARRILEGEASTIYTSVAMLDTQAAFDTVNHDLFDMTIFATGIGGKTWETIHSLNKGANTHIEWQGEYSHLSQIAI